MKTTKIFMMAALALMMTACSNDDNDQTAPKPNADGEITVTAKINVNDGSALTRAVADNGTTITSGLAVDEQIAVLFSDGTDNLKRIATVKSIAAGTATIEFTIPSTLVNNTACTLVYPATAAKADNTDVDTYANLLAAQTGALGANLDVRKGTATILNDGTTASLSGTPSLAAQFAIFKFTVKNFDGTANISVKPLTITIGTQDYVITPASATSELYVALPAVSGQTVSFSGTVGSMPWLCSKTGVSFDAGNFYQSTLKMLPQGAIPGRFTINAGGDKVYFSQGNLQATYDGSAWSWAFATNQWDFIGGRSSGGSETQTGNNFISGNGTMSTAGTVDLFGWVGETSTILTSDPAKYGISNSNTHSDYGVSVTEKLMSDWGNIMGSGWRTLSSAEWNYLFTSRTDANQKFGFGSINGVNGLIILPDSWTLPAGLTFTAGKSAWGNGYTTDEWSLMETAGAVFLPAAGGRLKNASGPYLYDIAESGIYWSSSPKADNVNYAMRLWFCVHEGSPYLVPQDYNDRYNGYSVRLVRDAE